jgi:hypothetical protein
MSQEEGEEESQEEKELQEEEPSESLEETEKVKKYTCKYCGEEFLTVPELGKHSKTCEARAKALEKKIEEQLEEKKEEVEGVLEGVPPPSKVKMSEREYVTFYGEEGLQKLKRQRLEELLTIAPAVGRRSLSWIMKQYDLDETARRDPNALMGLLQSGGIKDHIAYRIVNSLIALEEEYADLLRRQTQPYVFPSSRRWGEAGYPLFRQPQPPYGSEPFPRYPSSQYPTAQYPQPPQYPSYDYGYGYPSYSAPRIEESVRRAVEEEFRKRESQQPQAQVQAQVVTVTEPLRDAEGHLIYDKDGNPVYRKVTGPISQLGLVSQEDPELRVLKKMREYRELIKPEKTTTELSEEKIAEIIEKKLESKEEKITKEDILKAQQEAVAQALAAKEQEDKEEKRFERLERAIRETAGAKTVEGYQQDSYRFLGQGMQTLATREPKTIKVMIEGLERILYGPSTTTKEVEAGARESIFERLSEKYVSEE